MMKSARSLLVISATCMAVSAMNPHLCAGIYANRTSGRLTVAGRSYGVGWYGNAPYFGQSDRGRLAYDLAGESAKLSFLQKDTSGWSTKWTIRIIEDKKEESLLPPLKGDRFPGVRTEYRIKFQLQPSEGKLRDRFVAVDDQGNFFLTEDRKNSATLELFTGYSYWSTAK